MGQLHIHQYIFIIYEILKRNELVTSLRNVIDAEGNFVCLLGGKNTVKSLVL